MANTSWAEMVREALIKSGGQATTKELFSQIWRIVDERLDKAFVKHAIRSALDTMRKRGKARRVDYATWEIIE